MSRSEIIPSGEVYSPRYDLREDEITQLCSDLVSERGVASEDVPISVYVLDADDLYANLARSVEAKVFNESFENGSELMEAEYGSYESGSTFFMTVDHNANIPIGVMRVLSDTGLGLKSLNDIGRTSLGFDTEKVIEGYGIDTSRTVDIATLAVLKEYRGQQYSNIPPTFPLYRLLYTQFLANPNYDHTITMIDKRAEKSLKLLKFPFSPVFDAESFEYLGSPETSLLIAKNSMFYPQVSYWAERLIQDSEKSGSDVKSFLGRTMLSFIKPGELEKYIIK